MGADGKALVSGPATRSGPVSPSVVKGAHDRPSPPLAAASTYQTVVGPTVRLSVAVLPLLVVKV
jgi:hypothetical protein